MAGPGVIDVTDATFEQEVLLRSDEVPVVVDLWAPWCGPCKTLGPILERVVGATDGAVRLAKVNVDDNPNVAAAFRVQSIPAVYALRNRQVVDSFIGALPEPAVAAWVAKLAPAPSEADMLVQAGDEASLRRALELEPDHPGGVVALAELLVGRGETEDALNLLARVPETAEVRRVAALARLGGQAELPSNDGLESRIETLLDRVKDDDAARQEVVDLLEALGPEDPRTARYRRALTARLF
ncbi:MAG TPA: tetratricopeptide repeat protein [Acidimicrobiales bacterium]|nr:tetratricopeptide repeat protein [Acidimicrobiales bacterium]